MILYGPLMLNSFSVGSGETVITGKTFDQFLGLLWDTVKNKYWEWLNQCYSKSPSKLCSVYRLIL